MDIVKYTPAKRELIKKARPYASALDSMQKLCAELGYLKYTEFLSADKIFTVSRIATTPCASSGDGEGGPYT